MTVHQHSCGATWTGNNACHCPACHHTFSGLSGFDAHRAGDYDTGRTCRDPRDMGLTLVRQGVWGRRMTEEERAKFEVALSITRDDAEETK